MQRIAGIDQQQDGGMRFDPDMQYLHRDPRTGGLRDRSGRKRKRTKIDRRHLGQHVERARSRQFEHGLPVRLGHQIAIGGSVRALACTQDLKQRMLGRAVTEQHVLGRRQPPKRQAVIRAREQVGMQRQIATMRRQPWRAASALESDPVAQRQVAQRDKRPPGAAFKSSATGLIAGIGLRKNKRWN